MLKMEIVYDETTKSERIKVINVPGDGNCFFYAVVQQITGWTTFDGKFYQMAADLRKDVVRYLWNHMEEMRDILMAEIIALDDHQSGEDVDMDTRIAKLVQDLAIQGTWAGTESIVAIKELLGRSIIVFSPNCAPLEFKHENESGKALMLYYNGVNHYDSVWREDTETGSSTNNGKETQQTNLNEEEEMKNVEKQDIINKCYWITMGEKRLKARRIIEGEESYLWAISHQLSDINPGNEEFAELPKALKTDILQLFETKQYSDRRLQPTEELWKMVANTWKRKVRVFEKDGVNARVKVYVPDDDSSPENELKLIQTILNGVSQVDSVEIVIEKKESIECNKRHETENERREQTIQHDKVSYGNTIRPSENDKQYPIDFDSTKNIVLSHI